MSEVVVKVRDIICVVLNAFTALLCHWSDGSRRARIPTVSRKMGVMVDARYVEQRGQGLRCQPADKVVHGCAAGVAKAAPRPS